MTFQRLCARLHDHGVRRAKAYEIPGILVLRIPRKAPPIEASLSEVRPAGVQFLLVRDLAWWESRIGKLRGISLQHATEVR